MPMHKMRFCLSDICDKQNEKLCKRKTIGNANAQNEILLVRYMGQAKWKIVQKKNNRKCQCTKWDFACRI